MIAVKIKYICICIKSTHNYGLAFWIVKKTRTRSGGGGMCKRFKGAALYFCANPITKTQAN